MTVLDLITRALRDLKVYQPGEAISNDDAQDALAGLNDWIDSLGTEGLSMFTVARTTWTLVNGTPSYTIGTGGVINVARPVNPQAIQNIGYVDTSLTPNQEILLGLPLTEDEYAAIPAKTLTGTIPNAFYYNPTFGTTGLGLIRPFPIPTSSALQGVIYTPTPIAEFAATTDTVFVAPGYRRFYRTNLAKELAPIFDGQLTPEMQQAAADSKADIKRANIRLVDLSFGDAGILFGSSGPSNIYSGQ